MGDCCSTCRTGNEKRRLILKSLIQNLKIQTPVRNSLVSFLCCILHFCVCLSVFSLSVYRGSWRMYVVAWHCTTSTAVYLVQRSCLCRSLWPQSLYLYVGWRISADTGCARCRRVERTVLCEAQTYTQQHVPLQKTPRAPASSCNSTYLLKKRQEHRLVPFFRDVHIKVPFRQNINGKSVFSISAPVPLWITWKFLAEKFKRNSDIIGGIISEQPRINHWIFQPFICFLCMVI